MSGNEEEFEIETTAERNRRIASRLEHTGQRVALARIDRERRRLALEEERILARPDEPTKREGDDDDGPVVYFRKTFGNRSINQGFGYQYAAVRIAGLNRWFVTGTNTRAPSHGLSWDDLLDFILKEEHVRPVIWVARAWEEVEWNG